MTGLQYALLGYALSFVLLAAYALRLCAASARLDRRSKLPPPGFSAIDRDGAQALRHPEVEFIAGDGTSGLGST